MDTFSNFENKPNSNEIDLDFVYADADTYENEISEFYSYSENDEFQYNFEAFKDHFNKYSSLSPTNWQNLTAFEQKNIIMILLNQLDSALEKERMQAARCILYLAQGCWMEVQSIDMHQKLVRKNILLLHENGVFSIFVDLMNLEIVNLISIEKQNSNNCSNLCVILAVLYTITETMRIEKDKESEDYKYAVECFVNELNSPYYHGLLAVNLLEIITKFCNRTIPNLPIKKILLLLWKISLVSLGGIETLKKLKNNYRLQAGLTPIKEDTVEIVRNMRAKSPPRLAAIDSIDIQYTKTEIQQTFMIHQSDFLTLQITNQDESLSKEDDLVMSPIVSELTEQNTNSIDNCLYRDKIRLPWTPKVHKKDLYKYLNELRFKFFDLILNDDSLSTIGLPNSICEGINILKKYTYVSLADLQIAQENEISKHPLLSKPNMIDTAAEILYQGILPNLPQYVNSFMKIFLASLTSDFKSNQFNISHLYQNEIRVVDDVRSMEMTIDISRHKDIIIKAISAIILLFLKHFKINHIYQFEFLSQHLVFAKCMQLVLKFFKQNINCMESSNCIPTMEFPLCLIKDQIPKNVNSLKTYSWRNIFSCINFLRILNKLIKWKDSRIATLVLYNSASILKDILKVRLAIMQLYTLKLLKMQKRHLSKVWHKCNMKIISAIYFMVRHRLIDDWAFASGSNIHPWQLKEEECSLRTCIEGFNKRRYPEAMKENKNLDDLNSTICDINYDNFEHINNATNTHEYGTWQTDYVELTDEFKNMYELWLKDEVFNRQFNWDSLLIDVDREYNKWMI